METNSVNELFSGPNPQSERSFAVVALALVLPTCVFLTLSILKFGLGVPGPYDVAEPFFLNRLVELFTVLAPGVAFIVAIVPVVRLRVSWEDGRLAGIVAVRARPLNLLATLLTGLVVGMLVAYFLVENVLGRGA